MRYREDNGWTERRAARIAVCVLLVALAAGCSLLRRAPQQPTMVDAPPQFSAAELRRELRTFEALMEERLIAVSDALAARATDRPTREAAILFKARMIEKFDERLNQPDPGTALLDAWSFAVRLEYYFEEGGGRELFGRDTESALAVSRELRRHIERIAEDYLTPARAAEVRAEIDAFKQAYPLTGVFAEEQPTRFSIQTQGRKAISLIADLPFMPLRTATQAVNPMTVMAESTDRFADIVQDLPQSIRWQLELLTLQLEDSDTVTSALLALERFTDSTDRISQSVETLPADIEEVAQRVIADIERVQPELHATVTEARAALESAERTTQNLEGVSAEARTLLEQTEQTSRSLEATMLAASALTHDFQAMVESLKGEPSPDREPGRPFDILEYKAAVDSAHATITEARALLAELDAAAQSDTIDIALRRINQQTGQTVEQTSESLRDVIDYFVMRLFLLAVGVIVLLLLYRIAVTLVTKKATAGIGPEGAKRE